MNDELNFQIRIAKIQIYSSMLITLGGVFVGLGAAMFFTSQIIMGTEDYSIYLKSLVNSLYSSGISFLILGFTSLIIGWILPIICFDHIKKLKSREKSHS